MKKQTHQSENLRIKALNLYDNEEEKGIFFDGDDLKYMSCTRVISSYNEFDTLIWIWNAL